MIFVKVGDYYIGVNHIVLMWDVTSNGISYCKIVYGIGESTKIIKIDGTAEKIIESIRAQIKQQICGTPRLAEVSRASLLDFEEE